MSTHTHELHCPFSSPPPTFDAFSPEGLAAFRTFLKSEFSEENVEFWLACEDFKKTKSSTKIASKAQKIYSDFIQADAPKEVKSLYCVCSGYWGGGWRGKFGARPQARTENPIQPGCNSHFHVHYLPGKHLVQLCEVIAVHTLNSSHWAQVLPHLLNFLPEVLRKFLLKIICFLEPFFRSAVSTIYSIFKLPRH